MRWGYPLTAHDRDINTELQSYSTSITCLAAIQLQLEDDCLALERNLEAVTQQRDALQRHQQKAHRDYSLACAENRALYKRLHSLTMAIGQAARQAAPSTTDTAAAAVLLSESGPVSSPSTGIESSSRSQLHVSSRPHDQSATPPSCPCPWRVIAEMALGELGEWEAHRAIAQAVVGDTGVALAAAAADLSAELAEFAGGGAAAQTAAADNNTSSSSSSSGTAAVTSVDVTEVKTGATSTTAPTAASGASNCSALVSKLLRLSSRYAEALREAPVKEHGSGLSGFEVKALAALRGFHGSACSCHTQVAAATSEARAKQQQHEANRASVAAPAPVTPAVVAQSSLHNSYLNSTVPSHTATKKRIGEHTHSPPLSRTTTRTPSVGACAHHTTTNVKAASISSPSPFCNVSALPQKVILPLQSAIDDVIANLTRDLQKIGV